MGDGDLVIEKERVRKMLIMEGINDEILAEAIVNVILKKRKDHDQFNTAATNNYYK